MAASRNVDVTKKQDLCLRFLPPSPLMVAGCNLGLVSAPGQSFKLHILQNNPPCATIHYCQRLWRRLELSWKPFCESIFSSSVAFLMISVASQKPLPFNVYFSRGIKQQSVGTRWGEYWRGSSLVILFFAKKSFAKPTVALEHCREGVIKYCFTIFRGVSFWLHPLDDEECQYTFILFFIFLWILIVLDRASSW